MVANTTVAEQTKFQRFFASICSTWIEERKLIVKHVSGKVINESHTPIKGHVIVDSKTGRVASKCSAILVVETKNERMRTIREYEKQRDVLRSAIAR